MAATYTRIVSCGVEPCEGIKGTKQGNERAKARAKESTCSCKRGSEKVDLSARRGLHSKEEGKREVSSLSSLFLIVSPQLSMGPTDWWIGLSIGQPGEEVRCVCCGVYQTFSGAASDSIRAVNALFSILFVCRWSDKSEVEFQNWAEGSAGGPRKNGLCVTMSSSSGKRVHMQKHTHTDACIIAHVRMC